MTRGTHDVSLMNHRDEAKRRAEDIFTQEQHQRQYPHYFQSSCTKLQGHFQQEDACATEDVDLTPFVQAAIALGRHCRLRTFDTTEGEGKNDKFEGLAQCVSGTSRGLNLVGQTRKNPSSPPQNR